MPEIVDTPALQTPPMVSGRPARVLVVDDSRANVLYLQAFLTSEGYQVSVAGNGAEALEVAFGPQSPDIILLDVVMPVMDGIEAATRLKVRSAGRLLPVILVSSLASGEDVLRGLESGADDYLARPINLGVLRAKLRSWLRVLDVGHRLSATANALREHQAVADADLEIANSVIGNLVQRRSLNDPGLAWMVRPSAKFSGDIVAAERFGDHRFYAMIADATGHGLGAAISLLPVLQVFYGMTRKGLSVPDIAVEMNSCLRQYVPAGRFVAAALLCADEVSGRVTVWNGGMPEGFMLHGNMAVPDARLASRNLPLGILGPAEFVCHSESIPLEPGEGIFLYSDGLTDARDPQGVALGDGPVCAVAGGDLKALMARVDAHLAGGSAHDDISMLSYRLPATVDAFNSCL